MMGRPAAMLGDTVQAIETALSERYAAPDPQSEPVAVLLPSDGSLELREDPAGERTIEVALGPMLESPAANGSPFMAVEQTVELVLRQNLDLPDPNDVGEEVAAATRRETRRQYLNWVGDVVAFCRFLSQPGMNEFGPVRYVQGGPIAPDDESARELQWYVELAAPVSLDLSDSPAQARLRFGTYMGPVPANSLNFEYTLDGETLPDEAQTVTA